jgi:hypothetical protein
MINYSGLIKWSPVLSFFKASFYMFLARLSSPTQKCLSCLVQNTSYAFSFYLQNGTSMFSCLQLKKQLLAKLSILQPCLFEAFLKLETILLWKPARKRSNYLLMRRETWNYWPAQGLMLRKRGIFMMFSFYVLGYTTLLNLPTLRFRCVGGCWDRTQDCCDFGIVSQTLLPLS